MADLIPYQWSIKLDNGEIYVVQTATEAELLEAIKAIKERLHTIPVKPTVIQPPFSQATYPPCPKCGGEQTLSQKNKVYCKNKCWLA